jgi:hypothetical protein
MAIMVFPNRRIFILLALAVSAQVGLIQINKPQVNTMNRGICGTGGRHRLRMSNPHRPHSALGYRPPAPETIVPQYA